MRRLRVVSWNVGRFYSPRSNNRLDDDDIPQVARTLHELDGDIVLLQELVAGEQLTAIAKRLDALAGRLGGHLGAVPASCAYDRHVAVLVRAELEPRFEHFVLSPSGRGLVGATFAVGASRGFAASLHFDVFRPRRRRGQAQAVRAVVDRREEALVVAGGDLNLDPAFAARLSTLDHETFRQLTRSFAVGESGPTLIGLLRVDHVFARGALLGGLRTYVSPRRRLPLGDHDPVVCDLDLRSVDAGAKAP